jgi:hypothetical protein
MPTMNTAYRLITIKIAHTVVWVFFVACIVGIPITAHFGYFKWAGLLTLAVLFEVAILLFNHGRCPLTAVAARYTPQREANFDIYLPRWLAKYNKEIFSLVFLVGVAYGLFKWLQPVAMQ